MATFSSCTQIAGFSIEFMQFASPAPGSDIVKRKAAE